MNIPGFSLSLSLSLTHTHTHTHACPCHLLWISPYTFLLVCEKHFFSGMPSCGSKSIVLFLLLKNPTTLVSVIPMHVTDTKRKCAIRKPERTLSDRNGTTTPLSLFHLPTSTTSSTTFRHEILMIFFCLVESCCRFDITVKFDRFTNRCLHPIDDSLGYFLLFVI